MSDKQVAKALMPWLFGRGAAWRPFAKVRCEGGKCVWTADAEKAERPRGRNSKRALVSAA